MIEIVESRAIHRQAPRPPWASSGHVAGKPGLRGPKGAVRAFLPPRGRRASFCLQGRAASRRLLRFAGAIPYT
eukprot:4809219-Lingulodinium_polyedra.AAC.1